jgi:hypothetical protein
MSDEAEAPIGAIHITGCASHAISKDGQTAMIIFTAADPNGGPDCEIGITLPTAQLKWLRSLVHDIALGSERRGGAQSGMMLHFPQEYSVGCSDQLQGKVVLQFDAGTPTEMTYVFWNLIGLQIADALRKDIMPRLTLEERQQMMLIKPPGSAIIKPNG